MFFATFPIPELYTDQREIRVYDPGGKEMKKIIATVLIILMVLAIAACGGSGQDPVSADEDTKNSGYDGFGSYYVDESEEGVYVQDEAASETAENSRGTAIGLPASFNKEDVKLIFSADMYIQTLDFGEAEKGLYSMVEKVGGYFEYISQDNGRWYTEDNSYKYASYTVRVPSDRFSEFIDSVSSGMHVVSMSQNAQDVGQAYFDAERRLETLRNKHDRLEELLSNAATMTDIIELENALSDTEYQIEQYTSELKRYDSLIDYSTVTIGIEKVDGYATGITEELTFLERLGRSIKEGVRDFGWWLEDLVYWIGYHVIQLVILAVIIIVFVRYHLIKRIGNAFSKKKDQDHKAIRKDNKEENVTEE